MEIITFLQSTLSHTSIAFFKLITILGNEEFYLLILPILSWNWNKGSSKRLFILFLSGTLVAACIKGIIQTPRPQDVALIEVDGYSFPSGHAVGAVIFWGFLAWSIKKMWFTFLSSVLIILIALSRIVLGVHWPIDVFGGITIGIGTLVVNYFLNKTDLYLKSITWTFLLLIICIGTSMLIQTDDVATLAGLLFGVGIGLVVANNYTSMQKANSFWKNAVGTLLGCLVVVVLWSGLKKLLPNTLPFRFVRYAILGNWISIGAPLFFLLIKTYTRISSKPVLR